MILCQFTLFFYSCFFLFHMLIKLKMTWVDKKKLSVRLHIHIDKKPHTLHDTEQRNNKKRSMEGKAESKEKK